jgi:hypothetical protein
VVHYGSPSCQVRHGYPIRILLITGFVDVMRRGAGAVGKIADRTGPEGGADE